jgi:hypothetical protein
LKNFSDFTEKENPIGFETLQNKQRFVPNCAVQVDAPLQLKKISSSTKGGHFKKHNIYSHKQVFHFAKCSHFGAFPMIPSGYGQGMLSMIGGKKKKMPTALGFT